MSDLKLDVTELNSGAAVKLLEHVQARISALHIKNEKQLTAQQTDELRGQIKELRELELILNPAKPPEFRPISHT